MVGDILYVGLEIIGILIVLKLVWGLLWRVLRWFFKDILKCAIVIKAFRKVTGKDVED